MNWHKIIPSKKHICYSFIFLVVIVLIGVVIFYFSDIAKYFFSETQKYNGELFKVLVTILGGLLVLWGLYLNYRRTKTLENQTENQSKQIQAFVNQNKITEKGKVDERFKNAIEHLGNEKDAIVLGGIYALHRIAQEDKTYRQTVFDILCSYIREKTSMDEKLNIEWSELSETERAVTKPKIVIQTIIDLLFKIPDNQDYIYEGFKANLNGIICISANFISTLLQGADLSNAHLESSDFSKALLSGASLYHAFMQNARLDNAYLDETNLSSSDFSDANLNDSHFEGATFSLSCFIGASLVNSHLEGVNLDLSHFEGADFTGAYLTGSNLKSTHFEGANFSGAFIEGANLKRSHFEGAIFIGANLTGANLDQTHFEGANLGNNLVKANFEGVNSSGSPYSEFPNNLRYRIGKESEFSGVKVGKLKSADANKIFSKFQDRADEPTQPCDFNDRITDAQDHDTNIEKDAITGILTKEKAEEIIEKYNKAMAKVPKH